MDKLNNNYCMNIICRDSSLKRDATVSIYKNKIVLSSRACFVLKLTPGKRVCFLTLNDKDVCVSQPEDDECGFVVSFRPGRKTAQINSTELAGELAIRLGGHGKYRLSNKILFTNKGTRVYEIGRHRDA